MPVRAAIFGWPETKPLAQRSPNSRVRANQRSRLISGLAVAALVLPVALAAPAPAAAQTVTFPQPQPQLSANGEGEVMVAPDLAIVTLGVVSRGTTAAAALTVNSTELTMAVDQVKAAGVAEKDIQTSGFTITPIYQSGRQPSDQPPPIVGYSVSNTVKVTIRDVSKSGAILDQVVRAGANRLSGVMFDLSDRKAAEDQAVKAAIAEARQRGELMAEAAGVRLVRVVSVNASTDGGGPIPVFQRDTFAAQAAAPPPPVLPGQQKVTAHATVTWEIAPR
jgi:uncharacterized protein YggE